MACFFEILDIFAPFVRKNRPDVNCYFAALWRQFVAAAVKNFVPQVPLSSFSLCQLSAEDAGIVPTKSVIASVASFWVGMLHTCLHIWMELCRVVLWGHFVMISGITSIINRICIAHDEPTD